MSGKWDPRDYLVIGTILITVILALWKFYEIVYWIADHVRISIEV